MVYQRFCEAMGFGYLIPPLGLLTVGALLPRSWELRLIDHNFQPLTVADIDGVDVIMTGGMLTQQHDTLDIISAVRARGKPVVVGGPDASSSPHIYKHADFLVIGEAEAVIDDFIATWNSGKRTGIFEAPKFQIDVTRSPIPRFDLLRPGQYLYSAIQFSRGCPFTCEFCDIIELYGRVPRTKTPDQILDELNAIYDQGIRGPLFFVDDNLVGNKKELRRLLPSLKRWQEERGYPFEFSTQATINLADDHGLLTLLAETNFVSVFVGIESPNPEILISTKKKQNAIRSLTESVARIHGAGIFVAAGIIVGFDAEKGSVAKEIIEYISASSITIVHPGLLLALPNTQLSRRLNKEGRLHPHAELAPIGDQCTCGLNFDTLRPRRDILKDYATILDTLFSPDAYFARLRAQSDIIKRPKFRVHTPILTGAYLFGKIVRIIFKMTIQDSALRKEFWETVIYCARRNRSCLKYVIVLSATFFDLGPFARRVSDYTKRQIELIDSGEWRPPSRGQHADELLSSESILGEVTATEL